VRVGKDVCEEGRVEDLLVVVAVGGGGGGVGLEEGRGEERGREREEVEGDEEELVEGAGDEEDCLIFGGWVLAGENKRHKGVRVPTLLV